MIQYSWQSLYVKVTKRLAHLEEANELAKMLITELSGLSMLEWKFEKSILPQFKVQQVLNASERIALNEPIQYVLGYAYFYYLKLKVTSDTLIPRPETEELVALATQRVPYANTIVDFCTGSGCIALALASQLENAQVIGTDYKESTLAVAIENAKNLGLESRVSFVCNDLFDSLPKLPFKPDFIVSNPPYITENERAEMKQNVLDFEPHDALFVNHTDPLFFYLRILNFASLFAAPNCVILFEVNPAYASRLCEYARDFKMSASVIVDISGKDRFVCFENLAS
jgi:release factor glutamine methyltransferase